MKSDQRRLGQFSISGLAFYSNGGPQGLRWMFEGFVPMGSERKINMDVIIYYGWHEQFEVCDHDYDLVPWYKATMQDGKVKWERDFDCVG